MKKFTNEQIIQIVIAVLMAYLFGGVIGWIYETFICAPLNGEEINLLHGGLGIPFLTIYAIGAAVMEIILGCGRKQFNPVLQVLACAAICTVLEYISGLFLLHVVGVQTWDYRLPGWDFLVTPDGLICLRASLTFGIMGLIQLRAVRAFREKCVEKNMKVTLIVCIILFLIVVLAVLNSSVFHIVDVGTQWQ